METGTADASLLCYLARLCSSRPNPVEPDPEAILPEIVDDAAADLAAATESSRNLRLEDLALQRVPVEDKPGLRAHRLGSRIVFAGQVTPADGAPTMPVFVETYVSRHPSSGAETVGYYPILKDLVSLDESALLRLGAAGTFAVEGTLDEQADWADLAPAAPSAAPVKYGCREISLGGRTFYAGQAWDPDDPGAGASEVLVEAIPLERPAQLIDVIDKEPPVRFRAVLADLSPGREMRHMPTEAEPGRFIAMELDTALTGSDRAHVFVGDDLVEVDRLDVRTAKGQEAFRRELPLSDIPKDQRRAVREGRIEPPSEILFSKQAGSREAVPIRVDRGEIVYEQGFAPAGISADDARKKGKLVDDYAASRLIEIEDHGTSFDLQSRSYYVPIEHAGETIYAEFIPDNIKDRDRGSIMVEDKDDKRKLGPRVAYDGIRGEWIDAASRDRNRAGWKKMQADFLTAAVETREVKDWWRLMGKFEIKDNALLTVRMGELAHQGQQIMDKFMAGKIDRATYTSDMADLTNSVMQAVEGERSRVKMMDRSLAFVVFGMWNMLVAGAAIWTNVAVNVERGSVNPGRST